MNVAGILLGMGAGALWIAGAFAALCLADLWREHVKEHRGLRRQHGSNRGFRGLA